MGRKRAQQPSSRSEAVTHPGGPMALDLPCLNVLVRRDAEGVWSAEGLEIYYAATGQTEDEAKANFLYGLTESLRLNKAHTGSVAGFIRPAPPEVMEPLRRREGHVWEASTDCHALPGTALIYLKEAA